MLSWTIQNSMMEEEQTLYKKLIYDGKSAANFSAILGYNRITISNQHSGTNKHAGAQYIGKC